MPEQLLTPEQAARFLETRNLSPVALGWLWPSVRENWWAGAVRNVRASSVHPSGGAVEHK